MKTQNNIFEETKQIPLLRIAQDILQLEIKRRGYRFFAICPFHGDNEPSMDIGERYFRCYGCGVYGDAVDLVALYFDMRKIESAKYIKRHYGLNGMDDNWEFKETFKVKEVISQKTNLSDIQLHSVYDFMIKNTVLEKQHEENLLKRGLTKEEIEFKEYRSMPVGGKRKKLVKKLLKEFGDLKGVPGFGIDEGEWVLRGPKGIITPVRNPDLCVVELLVRKDKVKEGENRHHLLSSSWLLNGSKPSVRIHTAIPAGNKEMASLFAGLNKEPVCVTEGPMKGDIAATKMGVTFKTYNGVANWHSLLKENIPLTTPVVIAQDNEFDKYNIRLQTRKMANKLIETGYEVYLLAWEHEKGVDDALQVGENFTLKKVGWKEE